MKQLKNINHLRKEWVLRSDAKQGYLHITFDNGIHETSHGNVEARISSSGKEEMGFFFSSLEDLENKLIEQLEILNNKGVRYFQ